MFVRREDTYGNVFQNPTFHLMWAQYPKEAFVPKSMQRGKLLQRETPRKHLIYVLKATSQSLLFPLALENTTETSQLINVTESGSNEPPSSPFLSLCSCIIAVSLVQG